MVIIFKFVLQSQIFDWDLNVFFNLILIYLFIYLSIIATWVKIENFWVLWTEKLICGR